ncbi:rhamnogalacturonan lyase [Qipengyuania sp.]|uniref:rhamnogalacturonan lyase n=1 Tax=Qipengyuania sp. TaxID=2004515 RepID=UPI0035C87C0B
MPMGSRIDVVGRAAVAVPAIGEGMLVDWQFAPGEAVSLLRDGEQIATVTGHSTFHDPEGTPQSRYTLIVEEAPPAPISTWSKGYLSIPLDKPAMRKSPAGEAYEYRANDVSAGDLDGDGQFELVVKWDPGISKDNAFGGYTGETILDAYSMDGQRLWRIDLGPNIRSGAHYTQFMVADFDGDGNAEVMVKTADGTVDGTGKVLGDANADWRERNGTSATKDRTGSTRDSAGAMRAELTGRILSGPEFLTVFDGATGAELASAPYSPPRGMVSETATRDELARLWGDGYGNRSERYLASVAYLDGKLPSGIFGRGYYARSVIAAWDWRGGELTQRWLFDSSSPGDDRFAGQGNHQMSVADVDGDGRQEIIYGSMALDDDGSGLWSAELYHGDALHVGDLDPTRPGLERFGVHEEMRNGNIGSAMLDAATGKVLWTTHADKDTGRGVAFDIDPRFPGAEAWASNDPRLFDARGNPIGEKHPRSINFGIWWDGDAQRELLDGTSIYKWNWNDVRDDRIFLADGAASNNGTKATPALSADLVGDWREEVIFRNEDSTELRIYTTPYPTTIGLPPLMTDPQYRVAIAWQNSAYNQPPHLSFDLASRVSGIGPAK